MTERRKMTAALLVECGKPLEIADDVEIDAPRSDEALVRITHSGVCHSDLTVIDGPSPFPFPAIMGHEAAGVIVEMGGPSDRLKLGDRVVMSMRAPCGTCFYCQHDQPVLCEVNNPLPGKGEPRHWRRGQPVARGMNLGAYSEYALVKFNGLSLVPDNVPMEQAAVCGCAIQTAMGSVINIGQCNETSSACVIGLGGIGLATIMSLHSVGAAKIIGLDPVADRRRTALELGAHMTLDPMDPDSMAVLMSETGGRGFDTVFDNVGSTATTEQALALTRPGGQLILIGVTPRPEPLGFSSRDLVMRQKRVTGSFLGNCHAIRDMSRILGQASSGDLPLASLVTATMPLARINDALDLMRRAQGVRTILTL